VHKTPLGLADLARALRTMSPATASECAAIARFLGLSGDIRFDFAADTPLSAPAATLPVSLPEARPIPEAVAQPPAAAAKPAPFLPPPQTRRAAERPPARGITLPRIDTIGLPINVTEIAHPPSASMPAYIADAAELTFERRTVRRLPEAEPLVPYSQIRALAGELISTAVPGDLDIETIVDALAQGRLPSVLPRHARKGIARHLHIIVDSADSMRLFARDASALVAAVRGVAGPAVRSARLMHGPPPPAVIPKTARGDTIVILSDLGIGSPSSMQRSRLASWRDFAAAQHRQGVSVAAAVPFHHHRWPRSLRNSMRLIHWHRPGTSSKPATASDLRKLATVLSRAAVIDPALLRRTRLTLLPSSDGGVEADFANAHWTSVFNPRVIALAPAWVVHLRSELSRDRALLDLAGSLLQRPTSPDWERVVYEERVVGASLDASDHQPNDLKHALARIIRSLLGRMRDPHMARWALCFLDELSPEIQKTEAARLLKAVALIVLNWSDEEVADVVREYDAQWVFGKKVPIGLSWTGDYLIAREPPHLTDRVIEVPATSPRFVFVEEPDSPYRKALRIYPNDEYPAVARTGLPRRIKTIDSVELEVRSAAEAWQELQRAFTKGNILDGVVRTYNKKNRAWVVDVGFNALLPAHLTTFGTTDPRDSTIKVTITKLVTATREIIVAPADQAPSRIPDEVWADLHARFDAVETLPARLVSTTVQGWVVEVARAPVFVQAARLPKQDVDRADELIDQHLDFAIDDLDDDRREAVLSRMLDAYDTFGRVMRAIQSDSPIVGRIVSRAKGGLQVDIGGVIAFLPGSQVDTKPVKDHDRLIGQELSFKVTSFDRKRQNVVVSRRAIVEAERAAERALTLARLKEGGRTEGLVKNVTDYGVFFDLGGIDGLLHITDISWGRVNHPSEYFKVGDHAEVVVLNVDTANDRVSLGYKQKSPDPWIAVAERYPIGSKVSGKVVLFTDYGAFIGLEEGIDALIHVSEMSWTKKVRHPSKLLNIGDEVTAAVMDVNVPNRRISLSLKALEPNPWDTIAQRYPIGTVIQGRVRNLTDFGAFIEIEEGIDALIHISDMSWHRRLKHPSEILNKGDMVTARVINVDSETHRLSLSIREFLPNDWDTYATAHQLGDEVSGTIAKITDYGLFVRLADGVEGLLHVSEIERPPQTKVDKMFSVGEVLRVRIIKIDTNERKIGLSSRGIERTLPTEGQSPTEPTED
jgi:small subunit ribosomal protein S1